MKWLSYAWWVALGFVKVILALAVVLEFSVGFERVVAALLVILYVMIDFGTTIQGMSLIHRFKTERDQFIKIMRRLGSSEFDDEEQQEQVRRDNEKIERAAVKAYINWVFIAAVQVIAVLALLGALME